MPKNLERWSTRNLVAGTLILSALPLAAVEMFPDFFMVVMPPASYLLFHNIVEFFSVMVSLSMFGLGWYTYDQSQDRQALFLSTAFLAIGLLDFMHTLSNAAMPPFITPNSPNKSIQFWIAGRLFQAVAFLISAYVYPDKPGRWLSKRVLVLSALLVPFLVFTGIIFFPDSLPATFVSGKGLTPFKKISEYLIIGLLSAAAAAYWRRLIGTGDRRLIYYLTALIICIFSEIPLAFYTQVFDTYNVLGHLYKVAAFFLIYYGVFRASIKAPYSRLTEVGERLKEEIVERKRTEEALRQSEQRVRYFASQCLTAQETERRRVAGELHDSVASSLGAMKIRIETVAEEMNLGQGGPELLEDLVSRVREINNDVRRIMADLRPSILDDLGIIPAMNWFFREYQKTYSRISVSTQVEVSEPEVPDSLKTPIFRLAQEALNNIAKHSQASLVRFSLRPRNGGIELTIQDNGQGFDLATVQRGLGLSTMRERVQLSGGSFDLESTLGEGTIILVSWPG